MLINVNQCPLYCFVKACRTWLMTGACPRGDKCMFAHTLARDKAGKKRYADVIVKLSHIDTAKGQGWTFRHGTYGTVACSTVSNIKNCNLTSKIK